MIIDYELIAGLKFGIEADEMYMHLDANDMPDFSQPPNPVIYVHLGFITFMFMLD
jgi:hypothetical protein